MNQQIISPLRSELEVNLLEINDSKMLLDLIRRN